MLLGVLGREEDIAGGKGTLVNGKSKVKNRMLETQSWISVISQWVLKLMICVQMIVKRLKFSYILTSLFIHTKIISTNLVDIWPHSWCSRGFVVLPDSQTMSMSFNAINPKTKPKE